MKIVSIGEITIDHYLKQGLHFVGGISLNFAVNAKRAGADQVALISCVGDGAEGRWVLDTLAAEGVDCSQVAVLKGDTAVCDINVYENADRVFPPGGYQLNVLEQLQLTESHRSFIQQHDIYVTMYGFGQPTKILDDLLQLLNADQKKLVVDFGDWSNGRRKAGAIEVFDQIDLAFISGDEVMVSDLTPIAAAANCLVVITLGAAGSMAFGTDRVYEQQALPAHKVDSTGCGDAFQAAFTVSYFQDGDIGAALQAGAEHAAVVLQHYGAFEPVLLHAQDRSNKRR